MPATSTRKATRRRLTRSGAGDSEPSQSDGESITADGATSDIASAPAWTQAGTPVPPK